MRRRIPVILFLCLVVLVLSANRVVLYDLMELSSGQDGGLVTGRDSIRYGVASSSVDKTRPTVRIGVISRFAPNIIYSGYQPVIDYLNDRGTFAYELRLSTSYLDAVDKLRKQAVAASFLGAWIYAHLDEAMDPQTGLTLIAAPLNAEGESEFHAFLVTAPGSPIADLRQLKGKKVALPSNQSWSGNWLQTVGLPDVGLSVSDLDSLHHFDHHQTVVWQVLRGDFDAGVVKASVAARYSREGLCIVAKSTPFPGAPLVGGSGAPAGALAELTELILALDPNVPGHKEILDTWTPEFSHGFTPVVPQQYLEAFQAKRVGP